MTDDKGTKLILLRIAAELAAARAQRHLILSALLFAAAAAFRPAMVLAGAPAVICLLLAVAAMRDAWAISQEARAAK